MKYYRLDIRTDNTVDTFNKITNILGWTPCKEDDENNPDIRYIVWSYAVDESADNFDFINIFLDKLEPNFDELKKLGVTKDDITFWLLYEYEQQCGMEFSPNEMKRLGDNGITLCIDCWQTDAD
jgi:hypothetical protein